MEEILTGEASELYWRRLHDSRRWHGLAEMAKDMAGAGGIAAAGSSVSLRPSHVHTSPANPSMQERTEPPGIDKSYLQLNPITHARLPAPRVQGPAKHGVG